MKAALLLSVSVVLLGTTYADSVLELGFKLTASQPAVEWKEGVEINMTCKSECTLPCSACNSFKYFIEKRNKTYVPGVVYDDFKMFSVSNLSDPYQSKCRFEQIVSIRKVQKNESGTVRCISSSNPNRGGIAFLYIFYNANFTNVTLPTVPATKEVDMESTGGKLALQLRAFNATVDGENYPFVSCAVVGGSTGTTFQWSWANGSAISPDQGSEATSTTSGSGATILVTSRLTFRSFAEKGALMVGEYKCLMEGTTARFPVVFSAPVVKMSEKDYRSSMEGDTMTQSCSIVAYPGAVVTWSKDNQTLPEDGDRIKFSADNATLIISSLKQTDAGLYVCTAENGLGLGQAYIKLRVKDRLAALWPFLGILAEVVILVTIILLYEKKRAAQKRSQEAQEAAEDNNKEAQAAANDSDVRHRPAVKT